MWFGATWFQDRAEKNLGAARPRPADRGGVGVGPTLRSDCATESKMARPLHKADAGNRCHRGGGRLGTGQHKEAMTSTAPHRQDLGMFTFEALRCKGTQVFGNLTTEVSG